MKESLFSLLFMILLGYSTAVLAQETRPKSPPVSADVDRIVVEMSVVGNKIVTENVPVGKKIEIFSVIGLKVAEIDIKTTSGEYPLNVSKGYYILKMSDIVRKVAIR